MSFFQGLLDDVAYPEPCGYVRFHRGATTNDLKVAATSPPGMSVQVKAGYAFISNEPFKLAQAIETAAVAAPTGNPRIDLVQARLDTWDVAIKTGTEAASPSPPDPDADCLALGRLYLRVGMTCIKDADDASNGYIIDAREFV